MPVRVAQIVNIIKIEPMVFVKYRVTLISSAYIISQIIQRLYNFSEINFSIKHDLKYLLIALILTCLVFLFEKKMNDKFD